MIIRNFVWQNLDGGHHFPPLIIFNDKIDSNFLHNIFVVLYNGKLLCFSLKLYIFSIFSVIYNDRPLDWVVVERDVGGKFFKLCCSLSSFLLTILYPSNVLKGRKFENDQSD